MISRPSIDSLMIRLLAATAPFRSLAVVTTLLVFTVVPASGQVFVSFGTGFPLGPENVSDLYEPGFGAGAGLMLENTAFPFARLRPQGTYQRFRIEDSFLQEIESDIEDTLDIDVSVSGASRGIIFAGADLQLRIPYASLTPYVAPAAGVAFIATDAIDVDAPGGGASYEVQDDHTAFALGLGAGIAAVFAEQYELFLEAHYMMAFTDETERWIPIRFGLALDLEN